jgi:hypothetical protein
VESPLRIFTDQAGNRIAKLIPKIVVTVVTAINMRMVG